MPIHDWSRVNDGAFHDFHFTWTALLRIRLNSGLLPEGYYAQCDQIIGGGGPDVLALQRAQTNGPPATATGGAGQVATLAPPQASLTFRAELNEYSARQRTVVRHVSGHRVVALVEIVSRGNKSAEYPFSLFLSRVAGAIQQGVHVTIVDLWPPTPRDPNGVHAAVWEAIHAGNFAPPPGRPLTLVSYDAGPTKVAYVETSRVGDVLPPMSLFLESPHLHVPLPLEQTYQEVFASTPAYYRELLERE